MFHVQSRGLRVPFLLAGYLGAASAYAGCQLESFALGHMHNQSGWREFSQTGDQLVDEQGVLRGRYLQADALCDDYRIAATVSNPQGQRSYEGVTNLGNRFSSWAIIEKKVYQLQIKRSLTDDWAIGLGYQLAQTDREVLGAGRVQGFKERFVWQQLQLLAQKNFKTNYGIWGIGGYIGSAIGQPQQQFTLSNRDTALLQLGKMRSSGLKLEYSKPFAAHWRWVNQLSVDRISFDQGPDVVITQYGVPRGLAHQPRTQLLDRTLSVAVQYVF